MKAPFKITALLAGAAVLLCSCDHMRLSYVGVGVSSGYSGGTVINSSVAWTPASYDVNGFPIYGYSYGRPVYGYTPDGVAIFTFAAITAACMVPLWGPAPWYHGHWHYPPHVRHVSAPPRYPAGHRPHHRPPGGMHAPVHHPHGKHHGAKPNHLPRHSHAVPKPNHGHMQRPGKAPAARPNHGHMQHPGKAPAARPNHGHMQRPANAPAARPNHGHMQRPGNAPAARPNHGHMQRPANAPAARPNHGHMQRPANSTRRAGSMQRMQRPARQASFRHAGSRPGMGRSAPRSGSGHKH